MDEKYARQFRQARDQMYHYSVHLHAIRREFSPRHPTPQLQHLIDVVEEVVEQHLSAFLDGHIVAVSIDRYVPGVLPGFEELMEGVNSPAERSGLVPHSAGDYDSMPHIPNDDNPSQW